MSKFSQFFTYKHLPEHLQEVSQKCCELHDWVDENIPVNAESVAGLRKLLEAKDCFVRARLLKSE